MSIEEFTAEWLMDSDYVVAHTSGSTGAPQRVLLPKSDMRQSARATNAFFGVGEGSVLAIPLSMDYIAGKMMAVRAFEAGAQLDVISPSNAFRLPRRASLLSVVPTQVPRLLELAREGAPLADDVIVGGAALMPEAEAALVRAPWRSWCSYGMTETCSHVALRRVGDDVYHAMPGIGFELDRRGCLVVVAPAFSFARLATNDVAELLDSRSFRWKGRIDNVINSGALKLHPEELELEYSPLIHSPYYVVGAPHPRWGQCAALVVEGNSGEAAVIAASLRGHISHKRLPKMIWMVDALPRTVTGKVKRLLPDKAPDCLLG